jgi:hypothetical protein
MKAVKTQIVALDYILTGTIIKKYCPCGKKGCLCTKGEKNWHGPYHIWTRKENGKTVTKSLSPRQAKFCRKAIENMQKLKSQLEKWRRESSKVIENWSRPGK